MNRWLAATVVLAVALAVGAIAFLNGGDPQPVHLTPSHIVELPLGTALALAFAAGAAVIALMAAASAGGRAWRRWRQRRVQTRRRAALTRERLHAETLLVAGDADGARTRLTEAVTTHGDDERLLELLAGASEQSGDVAGAIAAIENARTRLPASPLLRRRLCALYATAGRWDDALALETELVRSLGGAAAAAEAPTLCGIRFEAAVADPEPSRVLRRLLALAREHPGFVTAWVAAGDRLRAAGRRLRARRAYERGARVRPALVLLERGAELDAAERHPERTVRTLRRLRRTHPHDASVVIALVRQHLRTEALDAAEAVLASWPEGAPIVPAIEALRGECCRRRAQIEQAVIHLARAVETQLDSRAYRCRACGEPASAWRARCTRCGRWDTVGSESEAHDADSSVGLMPSPSRNTAADHCVTEAPG
jgi:predicted Zn-dependent protease